MSGATFSKLYTHSPGDTILSAEVNAEWDNLYDNLDAAGIGSTSDTVVALQTTTDPGEVGSESLPTSVEGEIQRLRFAILELKQELDASVNQWYESTNATLLTGPDLVLGDDSVTTSSSSTSFTATTVIDGSAWDLSAVEVGYWAVASGGSEGEITAIDDGADTLTVSSWVGGTPSAGETVTVEQRGSITLTGEVAGDLGNSAWETMTRSVTNSSVDNAPIRGFCVSDATGSFSHSTTTWTQATNARVNIDTTGRPVYLSLQPEEGAGSAFYFGGYFNRGGASAPTSLSLDVEYRISRYNGMSTDIIAHGRLSHYVVYNAGNPAGFDLLDIRSCTPITIVDTTAPSGDNQYRFEVRVQNDADSVRVYNAVLVAYEI